MDKGLNIGPETIKLLEENTKDKLLDIGLGNILGDLTPEAKAKQKSKINKWNYIKLKGFCIAKETINKMKRQPWSGKKYLQTTYLIRG